MTEKEILKKLGHKIKQIRTEKGISQLTLGIEIDVEKSNVSRIESGRVNPRFFTLYKVSRALDISLSELVDIE
jgi:transcriptional regulator with XRE-family HTH domain